MKHSKFNDLSNFGLNQSSTGSAGIPAGSFALSPFMGIASPADVRPNLYGVD